KYESAATASSKLQLIKEAAKKGGEIDPNDLEEGPTQYQYFASYWAKLPMPLLGVHVIKLKQMAVDDEPVVLKEEPGLKIIAVIKESPAAKANIVKGDTLLKVGDVELAKADDLFAAVKRYAGQTVPVQLQRNGTDVLLSVALNGRK
ncbi:MAG: PDZ domain-containing protein, partial [Methylotenera sp.]